MVADRQPCVSPSDRGDEFLSRRDEIGSSDRSVREEYQSFRSGG